MNIDKIRLICEGSVKDGVDCTTISEEFGNGYAIELETGLFLYSFVRRLNPKIIVETGTNKGFSSACMALALEDYLKMYPEFPQTNRKIYTVDTIDHGANKIWNNINVKWLIEQKIVSSFDYNPPENIDFLWLDADHSKESVIKEWNQLAKNLNRNLAWVGFHDTRLDPREKEAIIEILENKLFPITQYAFVDHITFPNMRGIDFIQLRNKR